MMICLFQNVQELLEQSAYNWLGCHHRGVEASRIIIQHMWRYLELWHQDTLAHTFESKPRSLGSWDADSSNSNLGTRNASSSHCFLGLQWEVVVLVTGCPEGCPEWGKWWMGSEQDCGPCQQTPLHSFRRTLGDTWGAAYHPKGWGILVLGGRLCWYLITLPVWTPR